MYKEGNSFYKDVEGLDINKKKIDIVGKGMAEFRLFTNLGKVRVVGGAEKLVQSLRQIISTPLGSRFFLPTFGSKCYTLVYEPNDFVFRDLMAIYIKEAVARWEPRVLIDGIS